MPSRHNKRTSNDGRTYPFKKLKGNNNSSSHTDVVRPILSPKEITASLLQQCFKCLCTRIWWRLLPLQDGFDDISVGMGIQWDDLLPLLVDYGLLLTKGGKYQFNPNKWDSLVSSLDINDETKLNYTYYEAH